MHEDQVLVTGGSGFVGAHCIVQLLQAGYRVRTTLRSLGREPEVRSMVARGGAEPREALSFAVADLSADAGWAEAVAGCRYVLHVASPFPFKQPKNEDEVIVPAREGALRVLRAARDANVQRVVLTSSFVAVAYGHPPQDAPFDETSWTDLNGPGMTPYTKSKTLAERAAWEFMAREGGELELSVVNPGGIFGPVLGTDLSTTIVLIQNFLDGKVPVCPRLFFDPIDVRDVANLHLRAMIDPAAKGERFLAVSGTEISALQTAAILKAHLGEAAKRVPAREIPDWLVRLLAYVVPDLQPLVPQLGNVIRASNAKAKHLLGWQPRSNEECITATGESLLRLGLLKHGLPSQT